MCERGGVRGNPGGAEVKLAVWGVGGGGGRRGSDDYITVSRSTRRRLARRSVGGGGCKGSRRPKGTQITNERHSIKNGRKK